MHTIILSERHKLILVLFLDPVVVLLKVQVHAVDSKRRREGVRVPWDVQDDTRRAKLDRSRFHLLLRSCRFLGQPSIGTQGSVC